MNFLLYMAGRAAGNEPLRPGTSTRRETLMRRATAAAAGGQFDRALEIYRALAGHECGGNLVDRLICGQLQLALGRAEESRESFSVALGELLEGEDAENTLPVDGASSSTGNALPLAGALDEAGRLLGDGLYVRAMEVLRRARSRLEIVIAAEGGLALAMAAERGGADGGHGGLRAAVKMGDCLLRLMARVQLARHVSGALRERHLREDLAPWATRARNVAALLEKEYGRLSGAARRWPGHVETHLRRGLVAQATGRNQQAAAAFEAVLTVHPHHVPAAARRAVMCIAIGAAEGGSLRRALWPDPKTISLFARLAEVAADPRRLARGAEQFCGGLAEEGRAAARGNLALALAEVGARGDWEPWREPAFAGAQGAAEQ